MARAKGRLAAFEQIAPRTAVAPMGEQRTKDGNREPSSRELEESALAKRPLSSREAEVLALTAEGLTDQEIAARLLVARSTVMSHIKHILAKLEAVNRTHAVAVGFRRGLIG
jgi:DNA-binding NarL/FixJ family response regulator